MPFARRPAGAGAAKACSRGSAKILIAERLVQLAPGNRYSGNTRLVHRRNHSIRAPHVVPANAGIYRVACQVAQVPLQGWPDLSTAFAKTTRRRSTAMRASLGGLPLAMSRS